MRLPARSGQVYLLALLAAALALSACDGGRLQPETAATKAYVKRGATLYDANCVKCHGGRTGGNLKDIPPRHNANGHTWHHADQQLIDMTLNGITFSLEDQKMPAFKDKLSQEDVRAILAYIKTWWTEEQRDEQRKVTEQWNR